MNKKRDYLEEYKRIINEIIQQSFPLLRSRKIKVKEFTHIKFSARAERLFGLRIKTAPRLRGYNKKLLIGVFSHELSHLETFIKTNFLKHYFIRDFRCLFKKFLINEEKETDIMAIKKGYAGYLYLQRKSRWDSNESENLKWLYLPPCKIKDIAIKMNKWPGKYCTFTKKELKG
ncbi:MAG: hypothetical protein ABH804_01915 [archaeon]